MTDAIFFSDCLDLFGTCSFKRVSSEIMMMGLVFYIPFNISGLRKDDNESFCAMKCYTIMS